MMQAIQTKIEFLICKRLCLTPSQIIIIVANFGPHSLVANQLFQETVYKKTSWSVWNIGKVIESLSNFQVWIC